MLISTNAFVRRDAHQRRVRQSKGIGSGCRESQRRRQHDMHMCTCGPGLDLGDFGLTRTAKHRVGPVAGLHNGTNGMQNSGHSFNMLLGNIRWFGTIGFTPPILRQGTVNF